MAWLGENPEFGIWNVADLAIFQRSVYLKYKRSLTYLLNFNLSSYLLTKLATVNKNWSIIVTIVFLLTYLLMNLTHLVTMLQVTGKK